MRIGYQICLKLLRAGARVIATTRWPKDAALRYSQEHDFERWRHRLRIDALELSDPVHVEQYCDDLLNGKIGGEKIGESSSSSPSLLLPFSPSSSSSYSLID